MNGAKEDSFSSNQAINHDSRLNMAINPSYKLDSQNHILKTQNQGHYNQIGATNAPLIRSRGAEMSGLNYFSNKLNNQSQMPQAGSYIENPLGGFNQSYFESQQQQLPKYTRQQSHQGFGNSSIAPLNNQNALRPSLSQSNLFNGPSEYFVGSKNTIYLVDRCVGQGTFGKVFSCSRHRFVTDPTTGQKVLADYTNSQGVADAPNFRVALKIIKPQETYVKQGQIELKVLHLLNNFGATESSNILSMIDCFSNEKAQLGIVFGELLERNLYEHLKARNFRPLPLRQIRLITNQLLVALGHLHMVGLVHTDLKPENVMLVDNQNRPNVIRLIDMGSACAQSQARHLTYLQSRYYRSPEVLIGAPFSASIDLWSLGCLCVELFLGSPLYPGSCEYDQLLFIQKTQGNFPPKLIESSLKAPKLFEYDIRCASWVLKSAQDAAIALKKPFESKETRKYIMRSLASLTLFNSTDEANVYLVALNNSADFNKNVPPPTHSVAPPESTQSPQKRSQTASKLNSTNPDAENDSKRQNIGAREAAAEKLDRFEFVKLVCNMLSLDPEQRLSALDCLTTDFFTMKHLAVSECARETLHFKLSLSSRENAIQQGATLEPHYLYKTNLRPNNNANNNCNKNEISLPYNHHLSNSYNPETPARNNTFFKNAQQQHYNKNIPNKINSSSFSNISASSYSTTNQTCSSEINSCSLNSNQSSILSESNNSVPDGSMAKNMMLSGSLSGQSGDFSYSSSAGNLKKFKVTNDKRDGRSPVMTRRNSSNLIKKYYQHSNNNDTQIAETLKNMMGNFNGNKNSAISGNQLQRDPILTKVMEICQQSAFRSRDSVGKGPSSHCNNHNTFGECHQDSSNEKLAGLFFKSFSTNSTSGNNNNFGYNRVLGGNMSNNPISRNNSDKTMGACSSHSSGNVSSGMTGSEFASSTSVSSQMSSSNQCYSSECMNTDRDGINQDDSPTFKLVNEIMKSAMAG